MNLKDKYRFRDRLIHSITTDGFFKISIAKVTDTVETARVKHNFNPLATSIMARLFIGTALSTSNLKGEERIQIRIESDSSLKNATVEANARGELRGYCYDKNLSSSGEDSEEIIKNAVGNGYLHSTKILYGKSEPIVSSVRLEHSNITDDFTHYYLQSDQVPTIIRTAVNLTKDYRVKHALGFMIQAMPGSTTEAVEELDHNISELKSLSELYEEGVYIDDIMLKVLKGFEVKELAKRPLDFFCSCKKERFAKNLLALGKKELKTLLVQEKQELVCQYCNEKYVFSRKEIESLIQEL